MKTYQLHYINYVIVDRFDSENPESIKEKITEWLSEKGYKLSKISLYTTTDNLSFLKLPITLSVSFKED